MNGKVRGLIAGTIMGLLFLLWQIPDGNLHIIFCDVGQGDGVIVMKNNFQMLIDAGPANGKMLICLGKHMPFWDKQIEVVISSHNQSDHVGGLAQIKKYYLVEQEIGDTLISGDILRYSNVYFDVLWPMNHNAGNEDNEMGVVGILKYGHFKTLFTADAGEKTELALVASNLLEKIDVLKVPHHGSKFSSSEKFLEVVKPNEAVVSVGKNNSYGHPAAEILTRYDTLRSRIWRTDKNGEIEVITSGERYWIKTQKEQGS